MLLIKVTVEMLTTLILAIVYFLYMGYGIYINHILLNKSDELFTKTYCTKWPESPLSVQKVLLYSRQRSMQPTGLEVGGLYTGSLEFLSKLVSTSTSNFTVLYFTP